MPHLLVRDSPVGLVAKFACLRLIVRDILTILCDLSRHLRNHELEPLGLLDDAALDLGVGVERDLTLCSEAVLRRREHDGKRDEGK